MRRFNNPLSHVRIASPCNADWDQMLGNDRVRFCGQCNLNVYNLSELSRREAEQLVFSNEGRLCARFYRRADGSILTKNCPVGLKAIRRHLAGLAKAASTAAISFLAGLGIYSVSKPAHYTPQPRMGVIAQQPLVGQLKGEPMDRLERGQLLPVGEIAFYREKKPRPGSNRRLKRSLNATPRQPKTERSTKSLELHE